MKKIKFKNGELPAINDENLNQIQNNVEEEINLKSIIVSSEEIERQVVDPETHFILPDSYSETNSIITVLVNGEEITEYTIREESFVQVCVLSNAISNCTIKIICQNVSNSFIKFIQKNMSIG